MGTRLFFLLLLGPSAMGLMVARCPEGWKARGGTNQCYRVHSYGKDRTFTDARTYCQARGGDLAYIETSELRDWLGQLVGATGFVGQNAYMWVGAKNVDGKWQWVETGGTIDPIVLPWEGTGSGDCAALTADSTLIKQDCSQQLKFICHRNIEIPMACDYTDGWEDSNNRCYKKSLESKYWPDSDLECTIEGGHLITIHGDAEQQLARDLAVEEHDKVWIGYTEMNHPGVFTWVDGSDSSKTYWQDGQPDTSLNGFGAAVVDNDDPSGSWVVEKVTNEYHYLCEKQTGSCLPGWEEFETSCYYFNTEDTDLKVWQDAKETCEDVKARMVVLDTEAEDLFFRSYMPESDTLWIGLYSKPGEDIYWTDGTTMSSKNFTHMSDQDKNGALSNTGQQCAYLQDILDGATKTSSWVPTDCNTPRHYACEADAGANITLIPPSNDRYCPDGGWTQLGDHCYLFSAEEKTWTSARKDCQNKHTTADLVSVVTWAEQDFVFNNQLASGWLGLNLLEQTYHWLWSDGSPTIILNWDTREPTGDDSNCAQMDKNTGKWASKPCSDRKTYSCKMPASNTPVGTVTTTTAIPDTSACGIDWTENPVTGECYRIEVQEMIFNDARLHCQELDYFEGQSKPDLVSISSAQEQNFVFRLLMTQHLSGDSVWIGMTNDVYSVQWSDGTPTTYFNFANWEPGFYWDLRCIEMYTDTGKWKSQICTWRRPFICEKKGTRYVPPQPPPPPEVRCPAGWSYWDNNCYYFSLDHADWFTAESICQSMMNTHLASVTNQDEDDYIEAFYKDKMLQTWIGLRDDGNDNNWHWVDGSLFDWDNWADQEPNNIKGDEYCAQLGSWDNQFDGTWNANSCRLRNNYVCKMNVRTCPENWAYKNGKCYYVSDIEASRNEGQVKCQEVNWKATLVNIHSAEENQIFMEELQPSGKPCWIGLQYDGTNWSWADGTAMNYTNWYYGEPNHLETETCVEMYYNPSLEPKGKWENLECGTSRIFGCELYPTHVIGCEDGWEAFGDYCYWFSNVDYVDHSEAQRRCQDEEANLVSIHSEEENDFVFSLTNSESKCTLIGFTDIDHHLLFTWDDGTAVVFTEVSSELFSGLVPEQICGCFSSSEEGQWDLQDCTTLAPFVCKKPQEPLTLKTTGCEEGDLYYEVSCYNSPHTSSSWQDAKSDCESRGQHLLVLENQFEMAYISSMLVESHLRMWLGLSGTIASDGSVTFTWINGKPLDYSYWDKNEPNPEHGTCVAASEESSGFWGVRNCGDNLEYLCEYDRVGYTTPLPRTTEHTTSPPYYCLYDWEHKEQRCYKVMQDASTWGDAETKCVMFGGHLASVKDEVEQSIILALSGMDAVVNKSGSVWVGLVMNTDLRYEWTDGTGVDFVNWAEGQPDSHQGREICVSADASTLKLSDSVCLTHLPFICEAPIGEMMTTATLPTKAPLHPCSDDSTWYEYEDHCYKFISSTDEPGQTWWRAHELCRDEGGELASITSKKENYWIESMIYDKAGQVLWLGGRARLDSGYEWLDGKPFIYDNWASGEPNNVHDQEDCINMYTNNQGYWNDANCGQTAGRICKRQHGVTLPPPETTKVPDGNCPEDWLHTGTKCIYFIMNKLNFTAARQICQKIGSKTDLASVHSAAEQAYLMAAMVTLKQHMWLGMRYDFGFYWVDQTDVTYTNWGAGEPNGGAGKEECVEVSSETGLWNDISCSDKFGAICMMTQDPNLPDHHTPNKCPSPHDSYFTYDGACYWVVNISQTWQEAEATCAGEDAHLVSILTISENSFVWAASQQSGFSSLWTGLSSKEISKTYEWSDGWPTVFTNWGENEPVFNSVTRTCVIMNVTNGSWYTKTCDQSHTFLCKYTIETAPTPDPPSTGRCPDSRWKDLHGGYCYLFSNKTEKWADANFICMQEDSYLASVHSKEEMKLLTLTMQSYNEPFWIGLVETTNGESWTDGTSLNFVNWQTGEPNSHEEHCTEAIATTGYWNDVECDASRYYVCKTLKIQEGTDKPVVPPTTHKPGGGGGGGGGGGEGGGGDPGTSGLDGGGIAGIVITVLSVVAVMGFLGFSYTQKHRKRAGESGQRLGNENVTYSADNNELTVNVPDGNDA